MMGNVSVFPSPCMYVQFPSFIYHSMRREILLIIQIASSEWMHFSVTHPVLIPDHGSCGGRVGSGHFR